MSNGVEVATAWVRLVPSMDGATAAIAEAIAPGVRAAEEDASKGGSAVGGRFVGGIKSALTGAVIVGATAGLVAGLYSIGATFDDVTDTIRVGTGATGEALEALTDVAKEVGKTIPTSFEDAGQTVADVNTRLGLTGTTLQTVSSQFLEAGRILGEDVDIQGATKAMSAFGIEGDDVSGALDHLFQVAQSTGVSINDLATKTATAAPLVQNIGWTFGETAGLVGALDKAGLDASKMMRPLAAGLVQMAKSGEQPADVFPRVVGELEALVGAGDTAAALDLASGIFGTNGATQFLAAIQTGALNLDEFANAASATGDTILGAAADTNDFAESWQIVQNNAVAALEPLASTVFSALADTLSGLMPTLTGFGEWLGENQWVLGVVAGVIGVGLVAAFIAWTATIWAANVALLANPITWIVIGILLLIAAVVALVLNWDAVVAWIVEIWSGFVGWLTDGLNALATWWNDLWAGFGNWVKEVWDGFVNWVIELMLGWATWLYGIGQDINNWWTGLWSGIFAWAENLWQGYINWVLDLWAGFFGFMRDIGTNITNWWNGLWSGLAGFVGDAFNTVANFVIGGLNTVIDLVNGAIGWINDLGSAASAVTGGVIGWEIGAIPNIPALGNGGIVLPRPGGVLSLLAEKGRPEVVLPLDRLEEFAPRDDRPPLIYYAAPNQSLDAEQDLWVALERRAAV